MAKYGEFFVLFSLLSHTDLQGPVLINIWWTMASIKPLKAFRRVLSFCWKGPGARGEALAKFLISYNWLNSEKQHCSYTEGEQFTWITDIHAFNLILLMIPNLCQLSQMKADMEVGKSFSQYIYKQTSVETHQELSLPGIIWRDLQLWSIYLTRALPTAQWFNCLYGKGNNWTE